MTSAIRYSASTDSYLFEEPLACVAWQDTIVSNIPAMPLSEAHFGGFFLPRVCMGGDRNPDVYCQSGQRLVCSSVAATGAASAGFTSPHGLSRGLGTPSILATPYQTASGEQAMSPFKSYPVCKDAGVNGWEALPLSKQARTDRIKQMIEGLSA